MRSPLDVKFGKHLIWRNPYFQSEGSTTLGASLPEDGRRAGLRNVQLYYKIRRCTKSNAKDHASESHTQPSQYCSVEYFNLFFIWNPLIRSVLFSLYWVWLRCVLFILSSFHCLVHSQWVAYIMLGEDWNFTDLDLLQRVNSKVPLLIGELNTRVTPIVVDTEKLKWKANF